MLKVRFWSEEPPEQYKSYLTILPDYQVEAWLLNFRDNTYDPSLLVTWELHITQNIVLDVLRVLFKDLEVQYFLNQSDTPIKVESGNKLYELWNQVDDVHCRYLMELL